MEQKFIEGIAAILEVDKERITEQFVLAEGGYDSLAMLATISLIDELYNCTVSIKELREAKTIKDIMEAIKNN